MTATKRTRIENGKKRRERKRREERKGWITITGVGSPVGIKAPTNWPLGE